MALTQRTLRPDYRLHDEWTFREAGDYADGRGIDTIRRLVRVPATVTVDGHTVKQFRFRLAAKAPQAAACIDAASFKQWWASGELQGDPA
ncbi:MAG TPA: hypothetical protein VM695_10150 [Phycisphaerae bacterium]|nr:hypothetical protein [Phycisphaerae bacterium]